MKVREFAPSALAVAVASALSAIAPQALAQGSEPSVGLEEVIVTAQRRAEGLQDVPISVQAFDTQRILDLAAQDIADIGVFTPNVQFSRGVNQPRYFIRGLGTSDFGVGADPAVGVYLDGIYIGRTGGSKMALNDIERIEILNGPQGTLFGRNAAAGAVQYVTKKPVNEYEGWARAIAGNYDRLQFEGVYNMPLSDTLSWRTGALWNTRDGYIDNNFTGNEVGDEGNWSINTQLRWQPTDRLDMIFRAEYDEIDQYSRASSSATFGPRDNEAGFDTIESVADLDETRELWGTSLRLFYDISDSVSFVSISSYRTYDTENPEDKDGQTNPEFDFDDLNIEDNEQWSQEFRFEGEVGNKFSWLVGAVYFEEDAKQRSGINLDTRAVDRLVVEGEVGIPYDLAPYPGFGFDIAFNVGFPGLPRTFANGQEALAAGRYTENVDVHGQYESWAVFSDVTYSILDNLDLTLGIRYTEDEKEFGRDVTYNDFGMWFAFDETRIDENGNLVAFPDGVQGEFVQKEKWDDTTGRVVLDYRVTDDVLLYASYAEGYKAGGFNSASPNADDPPFDPEEITTWELGIKSSWFDNTLRFNAAYFDYDYENLQELEFVQAECLGSDFGSNQFLTSDIEGEGWEASLNWLATPGLEFFANAGAVDAEVAEKDRCEVVGDQPVNVDRSGETFADDFNYSIGANYTYILPNAGELSFSISWAWIQGDNDRVSCRFVQDLGGGLTAETGLTEINGQLVISQPSAFQAQGAITEPPFNSCPDLDDQERLNGRIAWLSPRGDWQIAAWITNATDWEPDGDPGGLGNDLRTNFSDGSPAYDRREEPRMYGLELTYTFK